EDIGLANPNALLLATNGFEAIRMVGWPEARIILSEVTIYLATSPKSNSAYMAIGDALALVRETGNLPIPLHLRNAPTKLMKELDYGKGYRYAHDEADAFAAGECYLPDGMAAPGFYRPVQRGLEIKIAEKLRALRERNAQAR
ncbi:MAG TPA: recombination factor protein RarA, partial [Rhodoferax sp.]|nr:recombination factor protein RarA [Rhodoferax sp.]